MNHTFTILIQKEEVGFVALCPANISLKQLSHQR
jgi:hypothetical protein